MNCPFLSGRQIKLCGAFEATLVLDVEELDLKCTNVQFHDCKLYKKRMRDGGQLSIRDYRKDHVPPML
jgi:hypothetical protein